MAQPGRQPSTNGVVPRVCHVSLEYSIPGVNYSASVGGLFKVVDLFIRKFPFPLSLIVPRLADFPLPSLPPAEPAKQGWVTVLGAWVPVHVHVLRDVAPCGAPRTFYLLTCRVFSKRTAKDLYECASASAEMVLYSAWSQAVAHAADVIAPNADVIHLHDYHGEGKGDAEGEGERVEV
ncbi:unnamed protein product [Closterium sp. NIES-53]